MSPEEDGGDTGLGAGPAEEEELRAHHAVELDLGGLGGIGVGEGVARAAGGGMIAHEHGRVKGAVHSVHHAQGVARPAADDLHALGQLAHVDVDGVVVGVVDQDIIGSGGDGSFTGGLDLLGHLAGGGGVQALPQLGLGPEGGEGRPLDISGNEYAHRRDPPYNYTGLSIARFCARRKGENRGISAEMQCGTAPRAARDLTGEPCSPVNPFFFGRGILAR